jgi:Cys-rich protein (TIGR01571 family)
MGWLCFPILMGQTMQRMKMNFFGCEKPQGEKQSPICMVYTVITLILFFLGGIILSITREYGYIIWALWGWYMLIVFTCARMTIRKKYKIEPGCCGDNCLDDCCNVYFCSCCTAVQMARHTHDENEHHYNCLSQTGLDANAPEIV